MNRIEARKNAMRLIYEWQMGGDGGDETVQGLLKVQPEENEYAIMVDLAGEVCAKAPELDEVISRYAKGWTVERLNKVDLAILRIGVCELQRKKESASVVINEAVEMAKEFSSDKAGAFVNGILGNYARDLAKA